MAKNLLTYLERTTLAGTIKHEVNCIAAINEESNRLIKIMTDEAMAPKRLTKFIDDDVSNLAYVQPGSIAATKAMESFIVRASHLNMIVFCS